MFAILLAVTLSLGNPYLDQAIEQSRNGDHEASEALMEKCKDCKNNPTYIFYKLVNAFKLNRKEEAIRYADLLINDFNEIPQRYRDLALIMRADMDTWKDGADDLDDISREMTKISDRLKNSKGGKDTQKMQKDVLARLDKMIKDAEDQQKAAAQAEADEEEARRKKQQREAQQDPANDTIKGHEQGTGRVDKKRVQEIAENWGKLPEKERAKAMVELTRNMPTKDRAVIEAYFRELSKRSGKK